MECVVCGRETGRGNHKCPRWVLGMRERKERREERRVERGCDRRRSYDDRLADGFEMLNPDE